MDAGDRVLCLDGGGIRGLIILEILDAIEKEAGKEIKDMFDWIGGTSTGGIIALGIATGKSVSEIRAIYYRLKDQVFKGSTPYDSATIENLLQKEFGDKVMTDIKKPKVLVTSVLGDHHPWKLHMFRSYKEDEKPEEDPDFEPIKPPDETYIWEVARCTSAAPTYFPPYKQFFDGGIMSNNPTLDILSEIMEFNTEPNQKDKRPLRLVVSIGCGYVKYAKQTAPNPKVPTVWDVIRHPIDTYRSLNGSKRFFMDLLEQVAISHGQPSFRARAWCAMMGVSFSRFSPLLAENVPLDCVDDSVIEKMLQETRDYIKRDENDLRIKRVASVLKEGPNFFASDTNGGPNKMLQETRDYIKTDKKDNRIKRVGSVLKEGPNFVASDTNGGPNKMLQETRDYIKTDENDYRIKGFGGFLKGGQNFVVGRVFEEGPNFVASDTNGGPTHWIDPKNMVSYR